MYTFLEWAFSRAALDPDAFSCTIIVAMLLVLMIATVVIWAVWRTVYIRLWRWSRRKRQRR